MELDLKFIGSTIVELIVVGSEFNISSDITDSNGLVCTDFIDNLRDMANSLESHNNTTNK